MIFRRKKIKTIDKLLKYKLNRTERRTLTKYKIINGCWWSWGFKFDNVFDLISEMEFYKNFDSEMLNQLKIDIKKLCEEHDIDFSIYKSKIRFYLANFKLAYWIFKLLNWANIYERTFAFSGIFIWVNKFWKKYYNKAIKYKSLEEILNKFTINKLNYGNY